MDLPEGQTGSPTTEMYLWEQPEEVSSGPLLNLEEQILNSTFEACDPQRTGSVAVTHVLGYLEAVTGQGPQDARLQTLAHSLDPDGQGPDATVDLDTFLVVMRDWIAACQLHGGLELAEETASEGALAPQHLPSGSSEAEEPANLESFGGEDPRPEPPATADLLSSLEDLELSNRRLAGENAKLQRSVETAEEGSARLGEEISALRKQLRSTQQALQFAKAVDEELEDLKTLAKNLEEQNRSLLAQARQTEKEQQHLVAEVETLQEENGKLLAERDGVKRRSEELATEKDTLKRQLYEYERLICQRDAILSERTLHAESLAKTLEEYRTTTQKQEVPNTDLSSPLCGVWQWEEVPEDPSKEAEFPPAEAPTDTDSLADADEQSTFHGEPVHPKEGSKKPSGCPRVPRREEEEEEEEEQEEKEEEEEEEEEEEATDKEEESQAMAALPVPLRDPDSGDTSQSPPDSSPVEPELGVLVPVLTELVPFRQPWTSHCLPPQRPHVLRITWHLLVPGLVLGLLLLLLSVQLLGQPSPPTWPHLQLCYLQPPPV
ncbi:protein KASH5 isoform X3 [Dipodomys merriami]|uniref:protein KASH5 isoform X3 n=1 Tax=Dipodomys merriami TaxID=94247 RepID=UPI003855846E